MPVDLTSPPPPVARTNRRQTQAAARAAQTAQKAASARTETLNGYCQIISLGLTMIGWKADAGAIEMHQPSVVPEVAKLADQNEKFAAFLDKAETVGPYWGLTMAVLPLGLQLLTNHGILKAQGTMGVVNPDLLAAQIQTRQMQAAAHAAKMQAEAAEQAARAEAEYREAIAVQNGQNGQAEE